MAGSAEIEVVITSVSGIDEQPMQIPAISAIDATFKEFIDISGRALILMGELKFSIRKSMIAPRIISFHKVQMASPP
ncbi:hypothetical protein [Chelativorans alearense]|uniref:hypothetical protein n=1 Tax=Chelativorans alearense TaxID=2681495 RepID=UPI0013D56810|nr:hypothetical protein [Chelativorans alearense]